ncbi:hypothetical protein AYL99_00663 [Fonsecaea erecta]|uniref:BTB domain-containing protein n=1 Tax=Fonsecaea erecta TaxID=1367422 RepID=A0A178ZZE7_9EURO|nr:hypothetical protein AYL99_00663 [Fonsecaea erecta]OAP64691.1 hypothetical protein AYL99_00663 [Fonsecaea erecta]
MENGNGEHNDQREKPLHELLTSPLVDIYVGQDSTRWSLHEELLCYHSPFFSSVFRGDNGKKKETKSQDNKTCSLEDEDDYPFELLVGWLYAKYLHTPKTEKDIGPLLDLYLLSEKLQIKQLSTDVVEAVREFYHNTSTYPGLRRVQYIYAETDEDNEMREMMVSSVARQLTTSDKIPAHWATALKRNGQLAVDIIRAIQQWHIEERSIPDVRDGSRIRGRLLNGNVFSAVERAAKSHETDHTNDDSTNLGVESLNSGPSDAPNVKSDAEEPLPNPLPRPPEPRTSPPDKRPVEPGGEGEEGGRTEEGDGQGAAEPQAENEGGIEAQNDDAAAAARDEDEDEDEDTNEDNEPISKIQNENENETSNPSQSSDNHHHRDEQGPVPVSPRAEEQEEEEDEEDEEETEEKAPESQRTEAYSVSTTSSSASSASSSKKMDPLSAYYKALVMDAWRFSSTGNRAESMFLASAWAVYLVYFFGYAMGKNVS